MLDWDAFTLFLYVTARMTGFVMFNPLLGRQSIPGNFRAGFTLVLSVFTYSFVAETVVMPGTLVEFSLHVLLELALGFVLGMVVNFFLYIPALAGHAIDTQMGMTMNQVYDASSRANMSVTGAILNTLMILLFFAANGHHTLLRIMLDSGQVVPYGAARVTTQMASAMLALFTDCTLLGTKLCMPILAAELLGQLGMGILMKVIPQINVFTINIELKVIIGLGLLLLLISPMSEFLLAAERSMLENIGQMLSLGGP